MKIRMRCSFAIPLALIVLMACSCGGKKPAAGSEEESRQRELELFQDVIRTVQDRYVDVDRTQLDRLISNSLKGMVTSVDPYAEVLPAGQPDELIIPPDANMVELGMTDQEGISILRIYGFNELLKKQLRRLESDMKGAHPSGILLDCRGAFGDDYSAAASVAEWLLPRDSEFGSLIEKQGDEITVLTTKQHPIWSTNTLIVLTDRQLSGPGELLAVALRHYGRCLLVGEPSRGVAVIQTVVQLADDWSVRLSTGRAMGPDGQNITGNPLTPDIPAQPETGNTENIDWVRLRGIEVLREEITGRVPPENP